MQPSMGDLPRPRLIGTKAFTHVGVDFAGPFLVKAALLRRIQTTQWVQTVHFAEDWKRLTSGEPCTHKLRLLGTYLDSEDGLLRVSFM